MIQKPQHLAINMIDAFERHGLFQRVGEKTTAPVPFVQSVEDYIESFHSRNGFSRERMSPEQAAAFDQEARMMLLGSHSDGVMAMRVVGSVVWGMPQAGWPEARVFLGPHRFALRNDFFVRLRV